LPLGQTPGELDGGILREVDDRERGQVFRLLPEQISEGIDLGSAERSQRPELKT
jgi:hypothetical protein